MITLSPLPRFRDLLKSIFKNVPDNSELANAWISTQEKPATFWFSRSSWTLYFIANSILKLLKKNKITVCVPYYFCDQALRYMKKLPVDILYYPVTKNLVPDVDFLEKLFLESTPDLILHVHYFGLYRETKPLSNLCKKHKIIFVEDAAHVLFPVNEIGLRSDIVFYSQHKLFSLPEGALCIIQENKLIKKMNDENADISAFFSEAYLNFLNQKNSSSATWLIKRILQKIIPTFLSPHFLKIAPFQGLNNINLAQEASPKMSHFSKKLLGLQIKNKSEIVKLRYENIQFWLFFLRNFQGVALSNSNMRNPLYLLPISLDTISAKNLYEKMFALRAPIQTWPDLPEEIVNDQSGIAYQIANEHFYFAIHQSLSSLKLFHQYAKPFFKTDLSKSLKNLNLSVQNVVDDETWNDLFYQSLFSNLLQSWSYSEAKIENKSWKVKRLMIKINNQPVAIVSVLIKSFLRSVIKIGRINRGPIFINSTLSFTEKYLVIKKMFDYLKNKIRFLLLAPELENNYENKQLLSLLGCHKRKASEWHSGYVNLLPATEDLRVSLDGKWRNQLKIAQEKYMLKVHQLDPKESIQWLLEDYRSLQQQNNFAGISDNMLSSICSHSETVLLCAFFEEKKVATILLYKHGNTCTYLLGCTTPEGRKYNANNFLLWHSIELMKSDSCLFFDVGGISEKEDDGISKFKRGLPITEYWLVGEYVKIF